jgi:hypothetical protein
MVHHVTTGLKEEVAHDFDDGGVLATCVSVGLPTGVTVVVVGLEDGAGPMGMSRRFSGRGRSGRR